MILHDVAITRMSQWLASFYNGSPGTDNILKIYKGSLPGVGAATDFDPSAHTSDELISLNNWTVQASADAVVFNILPDEFAIPTQSGLATWYALYNNALGTGSPLIPDRTILGEVTIFGGSPIPDGTLKIIDNNLVSGSPGVAIGVLGLSVKFVGV